jgi:hypothetical protein
LRFALHVLHFSLLPWVTDQECKTKNMQRKTQNGPDDLELGHVLPYALDLPRDVAVFSARSVSAARGWRIVRRNYDLAVRQ